jgi:hypothetical protein
MWELVFLAGFGLLLIICMLPETQPATILHERASRLRRTTPNRTFVTENDLQEGKPSIVSTMSNLLIKAIGLLPVLRNEE